MGNIFKVIELVGTSKNSFEEAINSAIKEASKTLKGLSWFEVTEQRGYISADSVEEFQVKIKLGFKVTRA